IILYIAWPFLLAQAWQFTYDSGLRQEKAGDYVKAEAAFSTALALGQGLKEAKYISTLERLLDLYRTQGKFLDAETLIARNASVLDKAEAQTDDLNLGGLTISYPESWEKTSSEKSASLAPAFTALPASFRLQVLDSSALSQRITEQEKKERLVPGY